MKMFLTRLGFGSKAVVTGDVTQIDLPPGKISGLKEADRVLANVEGVKVVRFDQRDVVRHRIVQSVVNAYEIFEKQKADAAAAANGNGNGNGKPFAPAGE
jgi:phosphate starvation-inducible PhoH-like protein